MRRQSILGFAVAPLVALLACGDELVVSSTPDASILDGGTSDATMSGDGAIADGPLGDGRDQSGSCTATPQTFAAASLPSSLAVGPTHVYWTEGVETGRVRGCARAGCIGTAVTFDATTESAPMSVLLDGGRLFWVNSGDGRIRTAVAVTNGGDGSPSTLKLAASPVHIMRVAGRLYWLELAGADGAIKSCDLGSAQDTCSDTTTVAATAYVTGGGVFDNGELFWTEPQKVRRCTAVSCGDRFDVASPTGPVSATLAISGEDIVFGANAAVYKAKKLAFDAPVSLGGTGKDPLAITTNGGTVFWLTESGVHAMPVAGGTIVDIATIETPITQVSPNAGIAVDAECVYWTETNAIRYAKRPTL